MGNQKEAQTPPQMNHTGNQKSDPIAAADKINSKSHYKLKTQSPPQKQ